MIPNSRFIFYVPVDCPGRILRTVISSVPHWNMCEHKLSDRYLIPEATLSSGVLDSVNLRVQCVRPGISRTLDEYRKLYGDLIRDAESISKEASAQYQLPLRLAFNATRGFHLSLSKKVSVSEHLPSAFLKVSSGLLPQNRRTGIGLSLLLIDE